MSKSSIRHLATIMEVSGDSIVLRVDAQEACGSCGAKSVCGSGEAKLFTLQADGVERKVGDQVTLVISRSMGFTAIAIAYFVPVVIVLAALLLAQNLGVPEMTAAWGSLALLGVYFVLIRIFRNKLLNQITITIE